MTALPVIPGISIRIIQQLVAKRCKVPVESMTDMSRLREFAWPRQVAMLLAHEFTRHSLTAIGRMFGARDHTTVLYACRAVPARSEWHEETRLHLTFLRLLLDQMSPRPLDLMELYEILGVGPDPSPEEIKAAHRAKVRECHPDLGGDPDRFLAVQAAYDKLSGRR